MTFLASEFVFQPPPVVSRARRILIKPCASYAALYPVTTSPGMLATIIEGIRQVSDADILILEGTPTGEPVQPIYKALGYDFPRVMMLDVRDCILVEVDNPLLKPLAIPTFWVPNVILSSDYLITVAPLKVVGGSGHLSIANQLSLLPTSKYGNASPWGWKDLYSFGIDKVISDLYFTLPFDLGIIEASQELIADDDPLGGRVEECGRVFVGEPYQVDREASEALGLKTAYLNLIDQARTELEEMV